MSVLLSSQCILLLEADMITHTLNICVSKDSSYAMQITVT